MDVGTLNSVMVCISEDDGDDWWRPWSRWWRGWPWRRRIIWLWGGRSRYTTLMTMTMKKTMIIMIIILSRKAWRGERKGDVKRNRIIWKRGYMMIMLLTMKKKQMNTMNIIMKIFRTTWGGERKGEVEQTGGRRWRFTGHMFLPCSPQTVWSVGGTSDVTNGRNGVKHCVFVIVLG